MQSQAEDKPCFLKKKRYFNDYNEIEVQYIFLAFQKNLLHFVYVRTELNHYCRLSLIHCKYGLRAIFFVEVIFYDREM